MRKNRDSTGSNLWKELNQILLSPLVSSFLCKCDYLYKAFFTGKFVLLSRQEHDINWHGYLVKEK